MSAWMVPGYAEERQLGRGASGRVVAAVSEATGRRVAIKYLSPGLFRDPAFLAGFRYEAELLRSLDVPQVVRLFDYAEEPGQGAAIVMELVDGVSLHEMISRRGATGPEAALVVLKGSLLGLAAAHALGIVHRDYKPENVLVDSEGNSKLSDFGVAVREGKHVPAAGTPLYMAPEQWAGAPASPATDIYAATAVFFECLTGKTPFAGRLPQLRQQHETAMVPLGKVDEPLRGLIAQGMAKNPADRPTGAIALVAELEETAAAAYGADWEVRGRSQLAPRAAALLPLLLLGGAVGTTGVSLAATWLARRKTRVATAIVVAAVVGVAAVATANTFGSGNHQKRTVSQILTGTQEAAFTAQVTVTPPVVASSCATPATFAYTGTITASGPGKVSYRWVYSSGQPGPVQTVSFTAAGQRQVPGETIRTRTAGGGWAAIKVVSPTALLSEKVSYRLLCGPVHNSDGITAAASVQPAAKTVTCGTTPPAFTAAGSITTAKAATITYYWALSDGHNSSPATLTFAAPGTMAVRPWTVTPQADPASGEAILVVTSPVVAASSPAKYTLSCTPPPPATLSASAQVSPGNESVDCSTAPSAFTFNGTITASRATTVSYHWKLPSGDGPPQTLSFTRAGTLPVSPDSFTPGAHDQTGAGQIIVTSPEATASNAATFTLSCQNGKPARLSLSTKGGALPSGTVGTLYSQQVPVTASGGDGQYTFTCSGAPAWLSSCGEQGGVFAISGTPGQGDADSYSVTLSVSDGESPPQTGSATFTFTIGDAPLSLSTKGGALPSGTVGTLYSQQVPVTASGGDGQYTFTCSGAPAWLSSCGEQGGVFAISGTPGQGDADSYSVTLSVSDGESPPQTGSATFTFTIDNPDVTPSSPPSPTPTGSGPSIG